jgi:hypothetical protein
LKRHTIVLLALFLLAIAPAAMAQDQAKDEPAGACATTPDGDGPRGVAAEVNVLWPFFPGGIAEFRVLVPVVRADHRDFRGELVLGGHSDFASRVIRDDAYGKVAFLAGKVGYRQFFVYGLHVEVSANVGWRHEEHRPPNDATVDGFQTRLWLLAGYQHEFSRTIYANVRGGPGIHIYRSDELAHLERKLTGGMDLNVGVRF